MSKKTFVLDTNVLLHNPKAIESFADNDIVLPMTVIEELDKFKKNNDELGRNARQVIRDLDRLRCKGNLREGVKLQNKPLEEESGSLRIFTGKGDIKDTEMDLKVPDNRIIRVAYHLKQQGENVIFVSKDINVRLKADALGLEVRDFDKQKVNYDTFFTGFREIETSAEIINKLHHDKEVNIEGAEYLPNEFAILKDNTNPKHTGLARYKENKFIKLCPKYDDQIWNIHPKSKEQRFAFELLMDPDVQLVSLVGSAGSGKTLLALATGLEQVINKKMYEKILVSRPIIPMGKDLGYLPGDKDDKMQHWMHPIFDNLDYLMQKMKKDNQSTRKKIDELMKSHTIEMEALTYIRGRSIPRQYVIIDEAQNLTPHEIKTIISRAGEGTKMILTGDPNQIDNPYLDASSNGLTYAVERLKIDKIHGHILLQKSERSDLSSIAARLL
jgi:PhoH-like ATPase